MLTSTLELEQEDVNPDDYSDSTKQSQQHRQSEISSATADNYRNFYRSPVRLSLPSLPFGVSNAEHTKRQNRFKLKRRFLDNDKENATNKAESDEKQESEENEGATKRSLFDIVEEDIRKRLNKCRTLSSTKRRHLGLRLSYKHSTKQKQQPLSSSTQESAAPGVFSPHRREEAAEAEVYQGSPPIFSDLEEEEERLAAKYPRRASPSKSDVEEDKQRLSGRSTGRYSQQHQQIEWDLVEVCEEEDKRDEKREHKKPEQIDDSGLSKEFDFDSLFLAPRHLRRVPRNNSSSNGSGNSSSRLTLSKNFLQQQEQAQFQTHSRSLLNDSHSEAKPESPSKNILTNSKTEAQIGITTESQTTAEAVEGTEKSKDDTGGGWNDMSIHHHHQQQYQYQQQPYQQYRYHKPTQPEVPETGTVLLLKAAAAAASSSSTSSASEGGPEGRKKMSGHSHYTRNKVNLVQNRVSTTTAIEMALAASLNEQLRTSGVSSSGRMLDGAGSDLVALSEDQQNMLNAAGAITSSTAAGGSAANGAGGGSIVLNLTTAAPAGTATAASATPAATPASIAAAANANNTLATLCNIGNSCYLNSVLYTLRFAPAFIHNLHHLIEDTDSVYQRLSNATSGSCTNAAGHNNQQQQQSAAKQKSSSLGRNVPGLHGSSGRSWSSKDLASLGNNGSFGMATATGGGAAGTHLPGTIANGTGGGTEDSASVPAAAPVFVIPSKSNRQIVTEQLHELFQNLHRAEAIEAAEPFHAGNILRAVQDVSATFEGNQQQDAHEFLMCILDSVRESCQALCKTIVDHPELLMQTAPPVPECIETLVPESKSSGGRSFFRRRKESVKTPKTIAPAPALNNATTVSIATNGGVTPLTLPKLGGGGDSLDAQNNLKNALLLAKSGAQPLSPLVLDERRIRERVQAIGLDFFRDDFEGVTVSKTKCLACETCTEQKETMIDIAIPIAASEVSDAAKNPQLFYQNSCITREYFRGDNKYRCEVCCGYREAIRSISFEILPRHLILQLKRFNGDMEKINSYIPTPFVLRCFCNTCLPKADCDKPHVYRLYSVITHVGARMSVGHYIAYTSSLDVHAEYLGCGKDRRKQQFLAGGPLDGGSGPAGCMVAPIVQSAAAIASSGTAGSGGGKSSSSEKSTSGQLKKLFSSKKASSAGDMSKKLKNNVVNKLNLINGIESLNLINGSSSNAGSGSGSFHSQSGSNSPSSNGTPTSAGGGSILGVSRIPCAGLNCCGIHVKNSHLSLFNTSGNISNSGSTSASSAVILGGDSATLLNNGVMMDTTDSNTSHQQQQLSHPHHHYHRNCQNGGGGTTAATLEQSLNQQLWHMCDDDKIKIMSQAEFEELLSPNRRHVITPYLLFYARYDVGKQQQPGGDDGLTNPSSNNNGCNNGKTIIEPGDAHHGSLAIVAD